MEPKIIENIILGLAGATASSTGYLLLKKSITIFSKKISQNNDLPLIKVNGIIDQRKTSKGIKFWIKLTFRNNCDKEILISDMKVKLVNKNIIPWLMSSTSNKLYKNIFSEIDKSESSIKVFPYSDKSIYINLFTCNMSDEKEFKAEISKLQSRLKMEMNWDVNKIEDKRLLEKKTLSISSKLGSILSYKYKY